MRYPLGIQDFRTLREGGYVYVDKTREIIGCLDAGAALFLSRPRRFGKSLTVATLNELYSGDRELFKGLWAYDNWDFEAMRRPVIWMKFNQIDFSKGLEEALVREVQRSARSLDIGVPEAASAAGMLRALITELAGRSVAKRCVILIDEYDNPMVDNLHNLEQAARNRDILKRFFGVVKGLDRDLEKVFITGVSAFSKVSLFSDLNHMTNLSLHPAAQTLVGWTQGEIEATLAVDLDATGVSREGVRNWYNGYSWGGERVYNPWSLIGLITNKEVQNYWYSSGSPSWLIRLIRDGRNYDLAGARVGSSALLDFRLEALEPIGILFQTGYLTIASVDREQDMPPIYTLDYPNREVRASFYGNLLEAYTDQRQRFDWSKTAQLISAFRQNDLAAVFATITGVYASVPYDFWRRDDESIFHAVLFLLFSLAGVGVRAEVHTAKGRCDAVVETATHVYAFEIKVDRTVAEALAQIRERGYLDAHQGSGKALVAIGVRFGSEERNVVAWEEAPY